MGQIYSGPSPSDYMEIESSQYHYELSNERVMSHYVQIAYYIAHRRMALNPSVLPI